jgi:hypothetical protein
LHASSTLTFAANAAIALHPNYAVQTACAVIPNSFTFTIDTSGSPVTAISAVSACTITTKIPHTSNTTTDGEITNILA